MVGRKGYFRKDGRRQPHQQSSRVMTRCCILSSLDADGKSPEHFKQKKKKKYIYIYRKRERETEREKVEQDSTMICPKKMTKLHN
jgi:hypothetical protein